VRQILISIVVTEPDDLTVFDADLRTMAMEFGLRMRAEGYPVKGLTVAHSPVVVDPRQLDGQSMYDALRAANEENNNAAIPKDEGPTAG
jgi:hypothetical protein